VGIAILGGAFTAYSITARGEYGVTLLLATPVAGVLGLWRLAVGQPWDEEANRAKTWGLLGDSAAAILGLAIAGFVFYRLHNP
jgi:hypothetical protein